MYTRQLTDSELDLLQQLASTVTTDSSLQIFMRAVSESCARQNIDPPIFSHSKELEDLRRGTVKNVQVRRCSPNAPIRSIAQAAEKVVRLQAEFDKANTKSAELSSRIGTALKMI